MGPYGGGVSRTFRTATGGEQKEARAAEPPGPWQERTRSADLQVAALERSRVAEHDRARGIPDHDRERVRAALLAAAVPKIVDGDGIRKAVGVVPATRPGPACARPVQDQPADGLAVELAGLRPDLDLALEAGPLGRGHEAERRPDGGRFDPATAANLRRGRVDDEQDGVAADPRLVVGRGDPDLPDADRGEGMAAGATGRGHLPGARVRAVAPVDRAGHDVGRALVADLR